MACNTGNILPTPPPFNCCPPEPPAQGCSAVWGEIVGTLGNQLDLIAKFDEYALSEDLEEAIDGLATVYVNRTADQDIDGVKNFNVPIYSEGVQIGSGGDANSIIIGSYSFGFPASPSQNTFIGKEAGTPVSGSGGTGNTAVGMNASPITGDLNFTTALGFGAKATKSGQVALGGPNTTETVLRGTLVVDSKGYEGSAAPSVSMNTTVGSVVMEGGNTLVVNNNKVTVFSLVFITVRTPLTDVNSFWVEVVNDGFFTIGSALPAAEDTRIDFLVIN